MAEFIVSVFIRGRSANDADYREHSYEIPVEADNAFHAEDVFRSQHTDEGRIRFVEKERLYVIEAAHVLRIEVFLKPAPRAPMTKEERDKISQMFMPVGISRRGR